MKGSIVWTTEMVSTKKPLCELTGLKRTTGSYVETTPPTPFLTYLFIYIRSAQRRVILSIENFGEGKKVSS
jgi:hypothetical protein